MKVKAQSIWNPSPCTLAFGSQSIALERSQRFSVHSIYHKEKFQTKNLQKMEILRPQSAVLEFRRKIKELSNLKEVRVSPSKIKNSFQVLQFLKSQHKSKTSSLKNSRLPPTKQVQIDRMIDINGFRSTFYTSVGEQSVARPLKKSLSIYGANRKKNTRKTQFGRSKRTDFQRPNNFNPGPGYYFLDKRDSDNNFYNENTDPQQNQAEVNEEDSKQSESKKILHESKQNPCVLRGYKRNLQTLK